MSTYDLNIPEQYNNEKDRQVIKKFFDLDLEPIKFKMIKSAEELGEEPKALSELDVTEIYYKLFLLKKFFEPTKRIAPSFSIDAMWHAHILDTRKYAEDCAHLFGDFVHHNPYFGMEETEGAEVLEAAGDDYLSFASQFIPAKYLDQNEFKSATCGPQPTLCDIFKNSFEGPNVRPRIARKGDITFNFSQ